MLLLVTQAKALKMMVLMTDGVVNLPSGNTTSDKAAVITEANLCAAANIPIVTLPAERYGLLLVFRVFERASYALVMNAARPVNVLDIATNP